MKLSHIILGAMTLLSSYSFGQTTESQSDAENSMKAMKTIEAKLDVKNPFKVKMLPGKYYTTTEGKKALLLSYGLEKGKMEYDPESDAIYGSVRVTPKAYKIMAEKADLDGDKVITFAEAQTLLNNYKKQDYANLVAEREK